jgi:hypothetical protein
MLLVQLSQKCLSKNRHPQLLSPSAQLPLVVYYTMLESIQLVVRFYSVFLPGNTVIEGVTLYLSG